MTSASSKRWLLLVRAVLATTDFENFGIDVANQGGAASRRSVDLLIRYGKMRRAVEVRVRAARWGRAFLKHAAAGRSVVMIATVACEMLFQRRHRQLHRRIHLGRTPSIQGSWKSTFVCATMTTRRTHASMLVSGGPPADSLHSSATLLAASRPGLPATGEISSVRSWRQRLVLGNAPDQRRSLTYLCEH